MSCTPNVRLPKRTCLVAGVSHLLQVHLISEGSLIVESKLSLTLIRPRHNENSRCRYTSRNRSKIKGTVNYGIFEVFCSFFPFLPFTIAFCALSASLSFVSFERRPSPSPVIFGAVTDIFFAVLVEAILILPESIFADNQNLYLRCGRVCRIYYEPEDIRAKKEAERSVLMVRLSAKKARNTY